jgi:hypothetical protein
MKLDINRIAEKMKNEGWTSRDETQERFFTALSNILLEDTEIVEKVLEEMEKIEEENHPSPRTLLDYLEKIGEV